MRECKLGAGSQYFHLKSIPVILNNLYLLPCSSQYCNDLSLETYADRERHTYT